MLINDGYMLNGAHDASSHFFFFRFDPVFGGLITSLQLAYFGEGSRSPA